MCLCILDTRPLSPGSIQVVAAMCSKVPFISNAIIKVTGAGQCTYYVLELTSKLQCADSFNLLVNNGVAAGQVIFHKISLNNAYTDLDDNFEWFVYDIKFQTHIHIIPRKAGDCLWTSESLHRRTLKVDQETSGLANRVRELLLNISEENKDQ
ncbi:hypothetical protein Goarm_016579, partial [Gossypium armourianum]|nr:hypothetical protein [Gossypium armourianum]